MGQYYLPVSLEKKESVYSHDYNDGLKLMEHSFIGNIFVGVVENLISKGGRWYKTRIVWAGDYADNEVRRNKNLYSLYENKNIKPEVKQEKNENLQFLVNLDTNEFVDLSKLHEFGIHPLPLLTCEGNGRGGGDFIGNDPNNLVGKWARNRVVMEENLPSSDMKELIFDLVQ